MLKFIRKIFKKKKEIENRVNEFNEEDEEDEEVEEVEECSEKVEIVVFDDLESFIEGGVATMEEVKVTEKIPLKKMKITSEAMEKIFVIAEATTLECYCLLLGKGDVVYDIHVPSQSATGASVNVQDSAIIEASKIIRETGLNVLGWAHSHASMSVFFSGTDDRNQKTLLDETTNYLEDGRKFVYGMTVNRRRDCVSFVTTQYYDADSEMNKGEVEIIPVPTDFNEIKKRYTKILNNKITGWGHSKGYSSRRSSNSNSSNYRRGGRWDYYV